VFTHPIVHRELRVAARRTGTYWIRASVAAFAVVICSQWFNNRLVAASIGNIGPGSFHTLSLIGIVVALGLPVLIADCISHERREGTLGLLFLTTLKSRDVILGKFAVLGSVAFYSLLGFAPMMLMSLTVGGVTINEVARMALALANALFFSLCAALLISTRTRTQSSAIMGTLMLVTGCAILPMIPAKLSSHWLLAKTVIASPIATRLAAFESAYATDAMDYWSSLASAHLLGWLCLVLAILSLRHNWAQTFTPKTLKARSAGPRRLNAPSRVLLFTRANRLRAFAPVARAVLRMGSQRPMAWSAAALSVVGSITHAIAVRTLGSPWAAAGTEVIFNIASSALFAIVAGRFFFESRRSGELELLLVTPVGARGILREQRLAITRLILGPLYLVIAGCIVTTPFGMQSNGAAALLELFFGLGRGLAVVLGVLAAVRVGMWFGSRASNIFTLVGWTVGLLEIVPTAALCLLSLLFSDSSIGILFVCVLVPLLLIAKNIGFIIWAGRQLRREFRAPERSLLDRMFRWFAAATTSRITDAKPPLIPRQFSPPLPPSKL
jgi:ABC-type transport system involved in multi-copper enzyme maturation permease subunit